MATIHNKGQENEVLTPEQTQLAKEFIWKYLEPHNRQLLVRMATTSMLIDNDLDTSKILIGFQYKPPHSHDADK